MSDADPNTIDEQDSGPSSSPTIQQTIVKVHERRWPFRDCQEAIQKIPDSNAGSIELKHSSGLSRIEFSGEDPVIASATLDHSLDSAVITLRVPTWGNMTEDEKTARDRFVNDLEVHERGHATVATTVVTAFPGTKLSAKGRNKGQARRNLEEKARQHPSRRKIQSELERLAYDGGRYDQVTNHGKTQSQGPTETYTVTGVDGETLVTDTFPGGNDIIFECVPCEETVQLSNGPHHLGDGSYSGEINCCFQTGVQGTELQITFEAGECQTDASAAEIVYTHRGVQADNPIRLNGTQLGTTPGSPSDGSTTVERLTFDPDLLQEGENVFEVQAVEESGRSVDDFELSDIRLELDI